MKALSTLKPRITIGLMGMLVVAVAILGEPPRSASSAEKSDTSKSESGDEATRVPLPVARDRAKLMHSVYEATLVAMHRHYFHGERAVVPVCALEGVFSDVKRESDIEARWISVSLRAMSIDHKPATVFEKKAAREIASGKPAVETVEDGYYRRAGAISLNGGGCIGCHAGFSASGSTGRKFAGLVISIPVDGKTTPRKADASK